MINVWAYVKLLFNLGFVVHPEKSVFVLSQEIECLVFIINSVSMTVRLTSEKKKIFDLCQEVLLKEPVSIVSKLLGKFTSSFQAIKYGQLHYGDLERLKTKALKIDKGNFDKKTSIDSLGKQDIIWWKNNIPRLFNNIRIGNLSFTIITDASTTGLGAVFKKYFHRYLL